MDKFIEAIVTAIKPPWNYVIGAVVLVIVGLPRVMELRDSWEGSRSKMRDLEYEKLRLEVMKLRRELQVAEAPEVPELAPSIVRELAREAVAAPSAPVMAGVIDVAPEALPKTAPTPPPRPAPKPAAGPAAVGSVRRFVINHPGIGRPLMLLAQGVMALLIALLGLATFGILIVGFTESDKDFGPGASVALSLVYAGLTWLSYRGFRSAASIRRSILP